MFRPRRTLPRSNRSTTTTFFRMSSSYFNFQLSTFNSVSLTPFPATLTSHLQRPEKSATLSLAVATLTSRVKRKSCVCHSYKKTPEGGGLNVNNLSDEASSPACAERSRREQPSEARNFSGQLFTRHGSQVTDHGTPVRSHQSLSPLQSALPQNPSVTPLDSALPKHRT